MGRKAEFGGGGGLFNNKDYAIEGYQFTTKPPFWANEGGFVHAVLALQEDGKDKPDSQNFFIGDPKSFEISKDGLELTPTPGSRIDRNLPWAKLMLSLETPTEGGDGHPGIMDDDEDVIAYRPILGSRVRLVQQPLSEAELAKLKKKGFATVRKDKTDPSKTYPLTDTVVAKFYSVGAGSSNGNGTGKAASGSKAASKGAKAAKAVDVCDIAAEALVAVLNAAPDNTLSVARAITKVGLKVMQGEYSEQAEDVKDYLGDDANLSDIEGVVFNKKKATVSIE